LSHVLAAENATIRAAWLSRACGEPHRVAKTSADYRSSCVICDGEYEEELARRGWTDSPMRAALERPVLLREVSLAFLRAGARVLHPPTAGAHRLASGAEELNPQDLKAINLAAVRTARGAVSDGGAAEAKVFGVIGPSDRLLMLDETTEKALLEAFSEQAAALVEGGVDGFVCRGFRELEALCLAVKAASTCAKLPVIGSLRFDCGPGQDETSLGVGIAQACAALTAVGAAGLGCDGAEDPDVAPKLLAKMRAAGALPLWVSVNAGPAQLIDGHVSYVESAAQYGARWTALRDAGAAWVCGGHGAGADHIAAMSASMRGRKSKRPG
jgi:methionine synthase I (cobalamin-dependent)